jgi:hypothetical protein
MSVLNPSFVEGHSSIRYQARKNLFSLTELVSDSTLNKTDRSDLRLFLTRTPELLYTEDSTTFKESEIINESPLFGLFYRRTHSFLDVRAKNLYLKLDPVLHFQLGRDVERGSTVFENSRGLAIQGLLDSKVYFFTRLVETQRNFLDHIETRIDRNNAIPGQGFYKPFESSLVDFMKGWDYMNAQGYVGFMASKSIDLQLGHGKNFIGNGYQSLLLDDYANPYFYFKINTRIWRLHYQNIFAELSPLSDKDIQGNELLPKKYMATHFLSIKIHPRFSIGLFETVIFGRENQFELQYLNPIIFYRAIERNLDSPDNVLLGLNASWNFSLQTQLYGQFLLDELRSDELAGSSGWWGNKYGFQLGLKYFNAFNIPLFDIQAEYNSIRPYTYAHRTTQSVPDYPIASYSSYNQPLGHPLGANFREFICILTYRVGRHWSLRGMALTSTFGQDGPADNFGGDILKSYETRNDDYNNFVAQGQKTRVFLLDFQVDYTFAENYHISFNYLHRRQNNLFNKEITLTHYLGLGFRTFIPHQKLDY